MTKKERHRPKTHGDGPSSSLDVAMVTTKYKAVRKPFHVSPIHKFIARVP